MKSFYSSDNNHPASVYTKSFLSPYARSLLLCETSNSADDCNLSSPDFLNFDHLDTYLFDCLKDDRYDEAIVLVKPLMTMYGRAITLLTTDELICKFQGVLFWLTNPSEFFNLHRNFHLQSNSVDKLLILLRLSAILEFSLGRLYCSADKNCPNMMKDLLQSPVLLNICGENCILLFKLFFGPVTSLNLRNLSWHGFLSPRDIEQTHGFLIPFLFSLVISLGIRLSVNNLKDTVNPAVRPSLLSKLASQKLNYLQTKLEEDKGISIACLLQYHPVSQTGFWLCFDRLDNLVELATVDYYLDILCISVICLTVLIRCEFALSCDWEEACISAEDRFFVTLDSILECKIPRFQSISSQIQQYFSFGVRVDPRLLIVLKDIFSSEAGPRLKDRLSHGQLFIPCQNDDLTVETNEIKQGLFSYCLILRTCIVSLLSLHLPNPLNDLKNQAMGWLSICTPNFSPIYLLEEKLTQLSSDLTLLKDKFVQISNIDYSVTTERMFNTVTDCWFPHPLHASTPGYPDQCSNVWFCHVAWSLTSAASDEHTHKPDAICRHVNKIVDKYSILINSISTFVLQASGENQMSARRAKSNAELLKILPVLLHFIDWSLSFLSSVRKVWLGGLLCPLEAKIRLFSDNNLSNTDKNRILKYLDQSADKLKMWMCKSKWLNIQTYLYCNRVPLPNCH